jgi:hypothetical protein
VMDSTSVDSFAGTSASNTLSADPATDVSI